MHAQTFSQNNDATAFCYLQDVSCLLQLNFSIIEKRCCLKFFKTLLMALKIWL